MPWSGGGYCVATLEQAARLECSATTAPCANAGARLLGYNRPTGKAFFAVPSADAAHPYSVDYVQINSCASAVSVASPSSSRWGADAETSAYCAVSPEASGPDFQQVGEFFAVGFFVVLSLYCSAIGIGAVLRYVRSAGRV